MPRDYRISLCILIAVFIAAGIGVDVRAQSIYSPGFREEYSRINYSARSVEINRQMWSWNDAADDEEGHHPPVSVRVSELGNRSGFVTDQFGQTVASSLGTTAGLDDSKSTGVEIFAGTRIVDRGKS